MLSMAFLEVGLKNEISFVESSIQILFFLQFYNELATNYFQYLRALCILPIVAQLPEHVIIQ